jgi:nucleoside-diphosphate-sugar epimerase
VWYFSKVQKILILGGGGFIGTYLSNILKSKFEVLNFTKKNKMIELKEIAPDCVINLCASKPTSGFEASLKSNISFPLACLEELLKHGNKTLRWIQVGSYFELQIKYGRSDLYSIHKKIFRTLITEISKTTPKLSLHSIILPHVTSLFDEGELRSRIFPTIIKANRDKTQTSFSNGGQFLPILHMKDACTAIELALVSKQELSAATPVWYPSIKELIRKCIINPNIVQIKGNLDPIDAQFKKVVFPPKVSGFKPQISAKAIVQSFKDNNLST